MSFFTFLQEFSLRTEESNVSADESVVQRYRMNEGRSVRRGLQRAPAPEEEKEKKTGTHRNSFMDIGKLLHISYLVYQPLIHQTFN